MSISQKWNLECFFSGGSQSVELQKAFESAKQNIEKLSASLSHSPLPEILTFSQELNAHIKEIGSQILCLASQNTKDTYATQLEGAYLELSTQFEIIEEQIDQKLAALEEKEWQALLKHPSCSPIAFALQERRSAIQDKLSFHEETLVKTLSIDGYHGWSQMFDDLMGFMTFSLDEQKLSFGQIENQLHVTDRNMRAKAFSAIHNSFQKKQTLFAQVLNHLGGFRIQLYQARKWHDILKEPLFLNRMTGKTLDMMWETISETKHLLVEYLQLKKKLLQLPQLSWHDIEAPLSSSQETIPYEEGVQFILESFSQFSPTFSQFAKEAIENQWVEAEDRPGKRPGGFCIEFPTSKQSRIFMTYAGTSSNVATLAHELGHAFHNRQVQDLPDMARQYRMNVAETASTMAEMIVLDQAVKTASSHEKKLQLLDEQLSRAVAFLMNIHARFLFERRFYEKRKQGMLTAEELSALMLDAQKEAYAYALDEYHPLFWASKLHFYFTDVPFYNFPYTFGYLLSLGLYSLSKQEKQFESKYLSFLQDTGKMQTEDLVLKHFGLNIQEPAFWQESLQQIQQMFQTFQSLAK